MIETEVSFVSLCYIEEGHDGRVWLHRLADVENGRLHTPLKSDRTDKYFENRYQLYWNDGPSMIGAVGVWEWTAVPNRNDPKKDYVESYYVKDYSPVRVVVLQSSSLEDIVEQLKNGSICSQAYFCDTLFCYEPALGRLFGRLDGVLCQADEFKIADGYVKLSENVHALPCFTIQTSDVYNWSNKNLRFLRELQLGAPSGSIPVKQTREVIRTLILDRSTRDVVKESFGVSNAQWRKCKALLERVCDESLYEAAAQILECTPEQARQAVDDFVAHANEVIEAGDIDAEALAQLALNHEELRRQCEESLSSKWKEDHAAELAKAAQEAEAAEQRLSSAEENRKRLLAETEEAQDRLDRLCAEIKRNETVGQDTVAAIRLKIADAQKDMAGFIASVSMFLPQPDSPAGETDPRWRYIPAEQGRHSDDIDPAEDWRDELHIISQNLANSLKIDAEFRSMLAAFLYSAHIHHAPLLIAGPNGCGIADALSMSLYAEGSGHLLLGEGCDYDIAAGIQDHKERIISVRNMFGRGWSDELPQALSQLPKQIVWTHPYVEDLMIEPKGLYHYMLPLFSECFIQAVPSLDLWPGKRAEGFKEYASEKGIPLRLAGFKRLGLSRLLLNRLESVLSDAKAMLDTPAKEKDMEVLLGLLPLSVLTGRRDVLRETVESESGTSRAVKEETARYFEEA